MSVWICRVAWAAGLAGCCVLASAAPLIKKPPVTSPASDGLLDLNEPLEPLVPKVERSEADEDRVAAVSFFAAGRMLEQQGDLSGALRRYQRSFRLDPSALSVVREIVQLAFGLGRTEEAVRYALKSVELDPEVDPELVERLGDHLAAQGEFADALKLNVRAVGLLGAESKTLRRAVLARDQVELSVATEHFAEAAAALDVVTAALEDRDGWKLSGDERHELLGEKPSEFWGRVGQVYLEAGRLDQADAAFEAAHAASADEGVLGYRRAQVLARRDQPAEALEQLDRYFQARLEVAGTAPYELLGELLTKAGREGESIGKLEELWNAQGDNLALGYALAAAYRRADRQGEAEALYRKLVPDLAATEGLVALVELDHQHQNYNDLIDVLGTCLSVRGDLSPLGEALTRLTGDAGALDAVWNAGRARRAADAAQRLTLDQSLALGTLALAAKQTEPAAEFFQNALEVSSPEDAPLVYLRWGFGLLEQDAYAEAARVFRQALDQNAVPDDTPDFRFHLAGALEMIGQTDEALTAAGEAIAIAERRAEEMGDKIYRLYPRTAWVNYHAKRYAPAREAYEQLLHRFDSVTNVPAARETMRDTRFALSNLCVLTGDMPAAEEYLEEILDEYPDDVAASNDLGYLWVDQNKNLARAQRMIELAVAAQPDNRAYRDSLGWLYYRQGRWAEAAEQLEKAAEGDEVDGVIYDHLGDAYARQGQVERAREAWTRAAQALGEAGEEAKAKLSAAKAAGEAQPAENSPAPAPPSQASADNPAGSGAPADQTPATATPAIGDPPPAEEPAATSPEGSSP